MIKDNLRDKKEISFCDREISPVNKFRVFYAHPRFKLTKIFSLFPLKDKMRNNTRNQKKSTSSLHNRVYLCEIEGIPIFPGHSVNFEGKRSGLTFKNDCLYWKYWYSVNSEKVSIKDLNSEAKFRSGFVHLIDCLNDHHF
jgi:hypothetical protein